MIFQLYLPPLFRLFLSLSSLVRVLLPQFPLRCKPDKKLDKANHRRQKMGEDGRLRVMPARTRPGCCCYSQCAFQLQLNPRAVQTYRRASKSKRSQSPRLSRMHVTEEGVSESVPLPVQSKCSNWSANYEHVHCTTATAS